MQLCLVILIMSRNMDNAQLLAQSMMHTCFSPLVPACTTTACSHVQMQQDRWLQAKVTVNDFLQQRHT